MQPKPAFLGPQTSSAFQESSVAAAYQHRPPYPAAVFDILADLITDTPRHVLDAGCGTGFLARPLAERVERVDALDVSATMIAQGQRLPGGDSPHLRWIIGRAEDATLDPPYALITAGDSLHWMEWDVVMPRFARLLTPHGYLAILTVGWLPVPWQDALNTLIQRSSTVRDFQPHDPPKDVEARGLFQRMGERHTEPVPFAQSLDAYVESFHGRASFSRERMDPAEAAAFDAELRALVTSFSQDAVESADAVELRLVAEVVWGKPLAPLASLA